MQWPWVSRERLIEAIAVRDSRILELQKQLDDLNRERKRLTDFIAVRSNNLSIYGEIKPPREEEEPEAPESTNDIEEQLKAIPPSRARAYAKKREEENLQRFDQENTEAERLLAEMQEAGRRAAEEQAKQ